MATQIGGFPQFYSPAQDTENIPPSKAEMLPVKKRKCSTQPLKELAISPNIRNENLSLIEMKQHKEKIDLLMKAAPGGKAISFIDPPTILSCQFNSEDHSFSFSKSAFRLIHAPLYPDATLRNITTQLVKTPKEKRWVNQSALEELLAQVTTSASASLRCSYNGNLYLVKAALTKEHVYNLEFAPSSKLTDEEASALGVHKTLMNKIIPSIYQKLLQQPSSAFKQTELAPQSNTLCIRLSLKNGLVTIGTDSFTGEGGLTIAKKIVRLGIHKKIYVKSWARDLSRRMELYQEGFIHSQLKHPYIVDFRKFSIKSFTLQTEYCDRDTTKTFFKLPPKDLAEVGERMTVLYQATLGLHYIQQLPGELAHADIKPANIFLKIEAGKLVGKLGDLSLEKEGEKAIVTPEYTDLEGHIYSQNNGPFLASRACDIWGLGLSGFEFLCTHQANSLSTMISKEILPHLFKKGAVDLPKFINSFEQEFAKIIYTFENSVVSEKFKNIIRPMLTLYQKDRVKLDNTFLQQFQAAITEK